ncbi:hypothetical protein Goarm_009915 [Gossypium armourianum]|uniref:Uncharacterized protein n=1 Tax=Gossypium armourianum TaxID=34283 RepID=A0A7J9JUG6_9ROSI|nr:hypothetical protein [Gossypium armourianum]
MELLSSEDFKNTRIKP